MLGLRPPMVAATREQRVQTALNRQQGDGGERGEEGRGREKEEGKREGEEKNLSCAWEEKPRLTLLGK